MSDISDDELTGCMEGFCYVTGKAKGMHTNGGCRCISRFLRSNQSENSKRIQIERLLLKLHKRLIDKESE